MNPSRSFEEFLKEGAVKRHRPDLPRARSLLEEAGNRKVFLMEMLNKIKISDSNANYFVETVYDILMESIRAKMLLDGFKASGIAAHEAEVAYLRDLGFSEAEVRFANELRYFRNGIVYYGKKLDADYARKCTDFIERLYQKLRALATKG